MNPIACRIHRFRVAKLLIVMLAIWHDSNVFAATPTPQIYWADTGHKIRRADLDGSNVTTAISNGLGNIGDFVIDRRTGHIYWSTGFFIYRSNLDGNSTTSLFDFPGTAFRGDITIDPIHNHLFFVDGRNSIIYRSNLDGSNAIDIVPARGTPRNGGGIRELWLDPFAEKLYWNYENSLHRTNLDGSEEEVLFTAVSGIGDFEIDPRRGKVYWTAGTGFPGGGTVRRANIDGSEEQILLSGDLWGPGGIALDLVRGKIYFTDSWSSGPTNYDSTIRIANLDGSDPHRIINLGPSAVNLPFEITLDSLIIPEPSTLILLTPVVLGSIRLRRRDFPRG